MTDIERALSSQVWRAMTASGAQPWAGMAERQGLAVVNAVLWGLDAIASADDACPSQSIPEDIQTLRVHYEGGHATHPAASIVIDLYADPATLTEDGRVKVDTMNLRARGVTPDSVAALLTEAAEHARQGAFGPVTP